MLPVAACTYIRSHRTLDNYADPLALTASRRQQPTGQSNPKIHCHQKTKSTLLIRGGYPLVPSSICNAHFQTATLSWECTHLYTNQQIQYAAFSVRVLCFSSIHTCGHSLTGLIWGTCLAAKTPLCLGMNNSTNSFTLANQSKRQSPAPIRSS